MPLIRVATADTRQPQEIAKNGGGAIANLNSVASFVSFPILAAYSASKAATHSLTQVTRAMLRGQSTQGVWRISRPD